MIVLLIILAGCYSAVVIDPEDIAKSNEADIIVTTTDGRQFSFARREYSFCADDSGQQVIKGKARVFRQGESRVESFEGSIPIDHVERISTPEKKTMRYVTIAAAGLAITLAVLWGLARSGSLGQ